MMVRRSMVPMLPTCTAARGGASAAARAAPCGPSGCGALVAAGALIMVKFLMGPDAPNVHVHGRLRQRGDRSGEGWGRSDGRASGRLCIDERARRGARGARRRHHLCFLKDRAERHAPPARRRGLRPLDLTRFPNSTAAPHSLPFRLVGAAHPPRRPPTCAPNLRTIP
jgi:hypothetical protein